MAAPVTIERTEAGAAYASPGRLMSPLGYVVVAAIMAVTAGVVYLATRNFQDAGQNPMIQEAYEEIDLGQVQRELSPDATLLREQFMVRVVLLLNPHHRDLAEVKSQVERRRNLLKHIVLTEIIYRKSDAELRSPDILETLGSEMRQRLNAEFNTTRDGQGAIHKVIFPESRLPSHR